MATELGQAYVQIMPSAKGISGSIQKTLGPEALLAGKGAGMNIAQGIGQSLGGVGKTMTKKITLPAVAAATAVGGIVAAFGWKRLVGLDSAKAQLKGLGYEVEAVDRIALLVKDSIQGTVTTMAEGVSIAAGALAAGVSEGDDLARYIKLVGDAAVGANRPISDMAMIFNRVQGSGKLMTQELNMIEQGMPGFAQAMADSLGVPQAEFRKMVTAGQISSGEFLDVMEGFAGDMSEAYANSWQGMVANTKSNIGILGENLLSGVFVQSKESIGEFLALLRSDKAREWAKEVGVTIAEAFGNLVQFIKDAVAWWGNLSEGTKKVIVTSALFLVAMGPVIAIVGRIITIVTAASAVFTALKVVVGLVGVAIGAITAPIAIAIAAIAAIIAIGVLLYKNWDAIKQKASELGQWLSETWTNIKTAVSNAMTAVKDAITEGLEAAIGKVKDFFGKFKEAGANIVSAIADGIKGAIGKVTSAISSVTQTIRDFLPFSPAKLGALRDLNKLNFGGTIADSIYAAENPVTRAMGSLAKMTMDSYDVNKAISMTGRMSPNTSDARLGEGIVNGLAGIMPQHNSQPIIIQNILDGKMISQTIWDPLQSVAKQKGVAFSG